ncbi:hypothetical protein [Candidatus Spongiihabitans sp.]|uniref:hypothetical protein n=1 Tax=Candidatus Spongiihabitans sp. TaxID=3101308 RepID=UPI003C7B89A4
MKPSMTIETQLIEMIAPRVDDIKTRFGNGEALQPDDINTLLLHSQYNHIHHLDQRLDEVADSVTALRGDFVGLKNDFALLQKDFALLQKDFASLKNEIATAIQTALNRNMMQMMFLIGGLYTLTLLANKLL